VIRAVRVVHYLWSAQIGGIERLVLDLAVAQRAAGGIEPVVLLGAGKGQLLDHYRRAPVDLEMGGLRGGADLSPARLRRITRLFGDADVVHLHSFHPLVARAAARAGVPVVYTEHGAFGLGRRRTLADGVKGWLKRRFVNGEVDFITFNSEHTRRTARSLFDLSRVPQEVVYNGTPVRRPPDAPPDPAVVERCRGRFVVGTVSRFTRPKRLDRLLDGFARLGDPNALLLLVGDGAERKNLEAQAERLGIGPAVVFAGYRTGVTAYQRLMDVCVLPSEVEAFGLAAVEALALGKPAIVFRDGGGMAEVVLGFEPRDVVSGVEELALRIEEHREALAGGRDGAAARIAHAQRFDIGVMAERMRGIYARLIREGPRATADPLVHGGAAHGRS
jgi:glycosyltransferase involved in cell wall biosynthesis